MAENQSTPQLFEGELQEAMQQLFDETIEPYFFDAVHTNEVGNRVVAERIATTVAAGIR